MKTLYMMIGAVRVAAGYVNEETGEITLDAFPRDGRLHYEVGNKGEPFLVWGVVIEHGREPQTGVIPAIKAIRDGAGLGLGEAKEFVLSKMEEWKGAKALPLSQFAANKVAEILQYMRKYAHLGAEAKIEYR